MALMTLNLVATLDLDYVDYYEVRDKHLKSNDINRDSLLAIIRKDINSQVLEMFKNDHEHINKWNGSNEFEPYSDDKNYVIIECGDTMNYEIYEVVP